MTRKTCIHIDKKVRSWDCLEIRHKVTAFLMGIGHQIGFCFRHKKNWEKTRSFILYQNSKPGLGPMIVCTSISRVGMTCIIILVNFFNYWYPAASSKKWNWICMYEGKARFIRKISLQLGTFVLSKWDKFYLLIFYAHWRNDKPVFV